MALRAVQVSQSKEWYAPWLKRAAGGVLQTELRLNQRHVASPAEDNRRSVARAGSFRLARTAQQGSTYAQSPDVPCAAAPHRNKVLQRRSGRWRPLVSIPVGDGPL